VISVKTLKDEKMRETLMREAALLAIGVCAGLLCAPRLAKRHALPIRAPGIKAWRMSKWVKWGGVLRTQGLCGDLAKAATTSTAQQTTEALAKLDAILADAGLTRANLLAMTIYIRDISPENFEAMNAVYDQWIDPEHKPTRLCVQAVMGHEAKVEIRAEAYCP
jgi:enamine deaminase RidA (YjgF/YER057c/UK114 family)